MSIVLLQSSTRSPAKKNEACLTKLLKRDSSLMMCVYESFFKRGSKYRFPIPHLFTSYCSHRDVAMTQFVNGTIRIAVALMRMATEIDAWMSVRVFEEMTKPQPKPNSLFTMQMWSGLHILTGHPMKTRNWQRSYFYVRVDDTSFAEPTDDNLCILWSPHIGEEEKKSPKKENADHYVDENSQRGDDGEVLGASISSPLEKAPAKAPKRTLWRGSEPPLRKPLITTSEHVDFSYNKEISLVNDYDACGDLAEKTIEAKYAEFKKIRKNVFVKAKEVVAERNHHFQDCEQARQQVDKLGKKLGTA
ncbi:hypothetical protein N665_1157s0006 [Sinapis alba]|nr:hypothetical protein N665_1157s0006 [Sinapis alba]